MTLAIDVRGLNKSFGDKHVVQDVSLQVEEGKICGFLGPNGSGKTTTLRMLCGLLTPDSGEGTALGLDIISQANLIKRRAGYMTQKFSLYEDLTIEENLQFSARIHSLDRRKQRVDQALERLGLIERRGQLAGSLSGGWKQRLALGACTLPNPKLLLLDEPTAGVDPKARRDFWDEIHRLAAEGITVLVSTHYMDEAERCHRLAYIAEGRLLASGSAGEVVAGQRLSAWSVSGADPATVSRMLAQLPGVARITPFGNTLHVTGHDAPLLASSMNAWAAESGARVEPIAPSLEDAFIDLMDRANGERG